MNVKYIKENSKEVKKIWTDLPLTIPFFSKMRRVIHYLRQYYIDKAKEVKKTECKLREELEKAQQELQGDVFSR